MNDFENYKDRCIEELVNEGKYFSSSGKAEKEKDCAHWFLQMLDIAHDYSDLEVPEQASLVDVKWRDARLQIKEITDPSVKRGEIKDIRKRVENADSYESLSKALVGSGRDIPAVTSMCYLVYLESSKLSEDRRYVAAKSELDLLFYVTRTYSALLKSDEIEQMDFAELGWRSVSVLNSKQAAVLSASSCAPEFLQSRVGQICFQS